MKQDAISDLFASYSTHIYSICTTINDKNDDALSDFKEKFHPSSPNITSNIPDPHNNTRSRLIVKPIIKK